MSFSVLDFRPAQYFSGKDCYVGYYVKNPFTHLLVRKKIKLNHIASARERKRYGHRLAFEINAKLYNGWNPFTEEADTKSQTIDKAVRLFLAEKEKSLRKDSFRCYKSFAKALLQWCAATNMSGCNCYAFERAHAARLMQSIEARGVSNKSYNNHCAFFSTLFLWFIEQGWCEKNPFESVKRKRSEEKQRVTIPADDRKRIAEYFESHNLHGFTVMMQLCFQCLIRPKELLMLKVGDIDMTDGIIVINGDVAKNHHRRDIAIPDTLRPFFLALQDEPPDHYLFSDGYKTGKRMLTSRDSGRTWAQMRAALKLPMEYQFYSLKDTGITEMLEKGVPAKCVQELADHHSIEMTEKYVHRSNAKRIMEATRLEF